MIDKLGKFFAVGVLIALVAGIVAAISSVFLMFGLDLLNGGIAAVPALGFFESFGALLALSAIGSALRGVKVDS